MSTSPTSAFDFSGGADARPAVRRDEAALPRADFASARTLSSSARRSAGWQRWLLRRMLHAIGDPPIEIVLWDGEAIRSTDAPARARIHMRDAGALYRVAWDPMFEFGQAYSAGRIDVDGDLLELARIVNRAWKGAQPSSPRLSWRERLWRRHGSSIANSRENIHRHYDLGNEFYKLWLDEELVYTCAYFAEPGMTLEQAQVAKLRHVCRKIDLQPNETVIEAGCGWGALALFMAREYGVNVRAYNISREQLAYARERAKREDLDHRVEFVEGDWRQIDGRCDAFVSVGMLEHVGLRNYEELGDVIHRCLSPHGRGLIHSIGQNRPRPFDRWTERRIFPGAYPPALGEFLRIFEERDFSVLDVENLRLHYAETIRHWFARYEQSVDVVREMFDEEFVRAWRLYLAGSAVAFEVGNLQLFQVVFAPNVNTAIPRQRGYMYKNADAASVRPPFFPADPESASWKNAMC